MSERIETRFAPGMRTVRKRSGRGVGSGHGVRCGRGNKGQNSRSGGGVRPGFEGGQMPLQRRLPKRGFNSMKNGATAEVRLSDLTALAGSTIDLDLLKKNKLISRKASRAKVVASGSLQEKVNLRGISVTKGARVAIEALGGTIE